MGKWAEGQEESKKEKWAFGWRNRCEDNLLSPQEMDRWKDS